MQKESRYILPTISNVTQGNGLLRYDSFTSASEMFRSSLVPN